MNFNWDAIASAVNGFVTTAAPIAEALAPEAAPAIDIGASILKGLASAEPSAKALVTQLQSGQPITTAQLVDYYQTYKTDDDALSADIQAHLDALKASS